MSALFEDMEKDITESFLNTNEFGESVTLTRGNAVKVIPGAYDSPEVPTDSVGIDVEGIGHAPRLYVKRSDLPDCRPRKGDRFSLTQNQFHPALNFVALDFVYETDGMVVYRLKGI